jgi:hypothetical protein
MTIRNFWVGMYGSCAISPPLLRVCATLFQSWSTPHIMHHCFDGERRHYKCDKRVPRFFFFYRFNQGNAASQLKLLAESRPGGQLLWMGVAR